MPEIASPNSNTTGDGTIDEATAALNKEWLDSATLVPIPPSKSKNDALYDDQLERMLRGIRTNAQLDVRELVIQANYGIDPALRDIRR
jgi:hypothetical protein